MNSHRASHAASAYRQTSSIVPPGMAVVRLYDSIIVLIQRAVVALQEKRRDESFAHIDRAASILRGLSHILDFERGGAIAERLLKVYSHYIVALYAALGKPDAVERYVKLLEGLGEMRDAWATVVGLPTRAQEVARAREAALKAGRPPYSVLQS
jgi:flagellar protein FliS